ncbi:unnamed protein product [Linum trigynum]|uniref:Uncharacterized protein n=1 Tax=Linum trigynum TaxID=586398 RepID=A0AAV2F1L5_9ROSI
MAVQPGPAGTRPDPTRSNRVKSVLTGFGPGSGLNPVAGWAGWGGFGFEGTRPVDTRPYIPNPKLPRPQTTIPNLRRPEPISTSPFPFPIAASPPISSRVPTHLPRRPLQPIFFSARTATATHLLLREDHDRDPSSSPRPVFFSARTATATHLPLLHLPSRLATAAPPPPNSSAPPGRHSLQLSLLLSKAFTALLSLNLPDQATDHLSAVSLRSVDSTAGHATAHLVQNRPLESRPLSPAQPLVAWSWESSPPSQIPNTQTRQEIHFSADNFGNRD